MPITINTNEKRKTEGQYAIDFIKSGNGAAIPVVNGVKLPCMVGYVSESDKQACIKVIKKAVDATGGEPYATARYIYNAMLIASEGITPDEEVDVDGTLMLLSYAEKKIYDHTLEIANLEDMPDIMDEDAIKAILIERARVVVLERQIEEYGEDEDEDDYWY